MIIFGTNSKEQLHGTGGDDVIFGLGGNDVIFGSSGADVIDGGAGIDTVNYSGSASAVTVNLATHVGSGGEAQGDSLFNIENLTGSDFNDHLTGDSGNNVLDGGNGNDVLHGGGGQDHLNGGYGDDVMYNDNGRVDFDGGAGNDTVDFSGWNGILGVSANLATETVHYALTGLDPAHDLKNVENLVGSNARDFLIGDAGHNELSGGGGNDYIDGGAGGDVIEGGAGADSMHGGDGIDWLSYEHSSAGVYVNLTYGNANYGDATGDTFDGFENVLGSKYNDTLVGDAGNNVLTGGDGNDQLAGGGGGHDKLYGGNGNDTLLSDGALADMNGGAGIDTADFYGNSTGVHADLGLGKVTYAGQFTIPTLERFDLVDIENLNGSKFNDSLIGDAGNNVLRGNQGNDALWGAGGSDTFVYERKFGAVDFGKDTIFDFDTSHDHLQIDPSIFGNFAAVQQHMSQIGNDTVITYDANDTITLLNVQMSSLHASDFLFA